MMFWGMMLCKIVGAVCGTAAPVDMVLTLLDAVADPVKAHVHGFGSLLLNGFVGDAAGCTVVGDHGGWWLGVAQFFEGNAQGRAFLAIVEEGGEFSFGGTGKYLTHNLAGDNDGAIHGRRWVSGGWWFVGVRWLVAEVVKAGGAGLGLRFAEVRSVALNVEHHVAGIIPYNGIRVCSGSS